ncbi:MAG: histidine phosphatase family protein [Acidobacteriaceae bacterium]|nr:histidine phosphatase family protein [Acidobacteriaceae bacterium]
MNLYILRHASAGVRRNNPLLDVKRPLDKDGKRHCLHLAHVLSAMRIGFDLIISSPLKRSLQTASFVGNETGYESRILKSKALEPQATLEDFNRLLQECSHCENLLVVGHNPNLTLFLSSILVPPSATAGPQIRLRKGSMARVSLNQSVGTLTWLLDPRTVRALYATSMKSSRRKTSRK